MTPDELAGVIAAAPDGAPVHIHAAEQAKEVADCLAWSGARPVQWLLEHAGVDARWCVVHATHMTPDETRRLAATGAVAGLAPTTEADLGDGTFAARAYLDAQGAFGIGSDSNTIIDPYAELRQLEWSQRLARQARNVLAGDGLPVGAALYTRAARGGAQALARQGRGDRAGSARRLRRARRGRSRARRAARRCAARRGDLRALPATGARVMVAGRWVVRDGTPSPRRRRARALPDDARAAFPMSAR